MPSPATPKRPPAERRPLLERWTSPLALTGLGASVFGLLWFLAWRHFGGRAPIHAHTATTLVQLNGGEASFFLAALLPEVCLCAFVAVRLARQWPAEIDASFRALRQSPERAYLGLACVAALLALSLGVGVLGGHPITEDEKTYLFQAKLLLEGRLSTPAPPAAGAFWQPFEVISQGRWSGQYPWAQPALLAPALLAGVPPLTSAIEAAVTVYFTGKLAAEYTRDARAGLLAAALATASPMLVMTGGTLHNANLAAACAAVTLWALARLSRGPHRGASIALGVATAIGTHNRAADQAAAVLGGGLLLLVQFRRDLGGLARRLAPAALVSLPLLALHPLVNHLAYGRWSTTGYGLFNGGRGWTTMGFGRGPSNANHDLSVASAKTLSAFVRVAFFLTGSPLAPGLFLLPLAGARRSLRAAVPLVPILVHATLYFFYAAASIAPTGPVYYLSVTPVLFAWLAIVALEAHDRLASYPSLRRAVPAALLGQAAAALVVFWPPQLLALARDVGQASSCEAMVRAAGIDRGLVFATSAGGRPGPVDVESWSQWPPLSTPPFDQPVLYARLLGPALDRRTAQTFGGDRPIYLERCLSSSDPGLFRYDPVREVIANLDGTGETSVAGPGAAAPADQDYDAFSRTWLDGRDQPPPPWKPAP